MSKDDDRWICPRCKTDCTDTKFHVTGIETNRFGADKFIFLCDPCFHDKLSETEMKIYFKKAIFDL